MHTQNARRGATHEPPGLEYIARGILRRGEAILFCQNRKHGYYYLPGGHVEPGETAAEACAREFREENGLRIGVRACGLVCEQRFVQRGKPRHEITAVFHVEPEDGAPPAVVQSLEEHVAFAWRTPQQIHAMPQAQLPGTGIRRWLLREDRPPTAGAVWESVTDAEYTKAMASL